MKRAAVPPLAAAERLTVAHYVAHISRFLNGPCAVLEPTTGQRAVGSTDVRLMAGSVAHRSRDAVDHHWFGYHNPGGCTEHRMLQPFVDGPMGDGPAARILWYNLAYHEG